MHSQPTSLGYSHYTPFRLIKLDLYQTITRSISALNPHCCVSLLSEIESSPLHISEQLGHKAIRTPAQTYFPAYQGTRESKSAQFLLTTFVLWGKKASNPHDEWGCGNDGMIPILATILNESILLQEDLNFHRETLSFVLLHSSLFT